MTDTLMKVIVDCSTGESVTVPLTQEELAQRELDQATYEAQEAQRLADEEALAALKASAKTKLIAGQPLTEAEASTIVF